MTIPENEWLRTARLDTLTGEYIELSSAIGKGKDNIRTHAFGTLKVGYGMAETIAAVERKRRRDFIVANQGKKKERRRVV